MESVNIRELNERIQKESSFVDLLTLEMGKVIGRNRGDAVHSYAVG